MSLHNSEPISVKGDLSDDKRSAVVEFVRDDIVVFEEEFDAISLECFIKELADLRRGLLDPVPHDRPQFMAVDEMDPRWTVSPDTKNKFPVLCVRHQGMGWLCFGIPRHEAREISKYLRKTPVVETMRDTQPPAASSIEGGGIFLSSHGLGPYHLGAGEDHIGAAVFEQIEWDSDRSAGIVAAAVLEQRIEEALKSEMHRNTTSTWKNLFGISKPLNAFGPKIDLAHMLGLLSDEARKDIHTITKIRNDFAHRLELDSFTAQSIHAKCGNLKLIDKYVGPPPTIEEFTAGSDPQRPKHYIGRTNHAELLKDPRSRYVLTINLLSFALGQDAVNTADHDRPII